jgi:hypothetical protein
LFIVETYRRDIAAIFELEVHFESFAAAVDCEL